MQSNGVRAKVWLDFHKIAKFCGISLKLAETEGFEPSIGLYNPITV
jgi:hypothetical protein